MLKKSIAMTFVGLDLMDPSIGRSTKLFDPSTMVIDNLFMHGIIGNASTDGCHIVVGTGSTQLFQDALHALYSSQTIEPSIVKAWIERSEEAKARANICTHFILPWFSC